MFSVPVLSNSLLKVSSSRAGINFLIISALSFSSLVSVVILPKLNLEPSSTEKIISKFLLLIN